jgi:acetyl-CoA carboxylase beta subunit
VLPLAAKEKTMENQNKSKTPVEQPRLVRRDLWNKCDVCGRIISYADIQSGKAIHNMKTPDSEVSFETWENLCRDHYQPNTPDQERKSPASECSI